MVHFFLFPNKCPYSSICPWVSKFSLGHFWGDKLVHSFKEDRLKLYPHIVNIDVSKILQHKTVCKCPYVVFKILHIDPLIQETLTRWLEDPVCFNVIFHQNYIPWSARPTGGIPLTLVTGVGLFVSRMSRALSCPVGISITWERQCSWTISTKCDCTCLLGIPRGTYSLFQSISPQLKSPPMRTWECLYAMIRFRELLS